MLDEEALAAIQHKLGLVFNDPSLLQVALTPQVPGKSTQINLDFARLEFLGDGALKALLTTWIYRNVAGEIKTMATTLDKLSRIEARGAAGEALGLLEYQDLSPVQRRTWESRGSGRARQSRAANLLEALLGAIYEDRGAEAAESFFWRSIQPVMHEQLGEDATFDARGRLFEIVWHLHGEPCKYRVIYEGHSVPRDRHVELTVADEVWATERSCDEDKSSIAARMAGRILMERFGVTNDAEARAKIKEIKYGQLK